MTTKQTKRDLTYNEKRTIALALGKIRVKAYKMSQKTIYNANAKRTLQRIEKAIWNITNNM